MTPEQMRDASLLELFSLEAEAQTQVLSAGLLALERNPTEADQLEACMRAAHSLKGAARIVGLDAGVRVAHVMEDCLVGAQERRLYLMPEHIDALLLGTDLLMRIGTPGDGAPGTTAIDAFVAQMAAVMDPLATAAKALTPSHPTPPPVAAALAVHPDTAPPDTAPLEPDAVITNKTRRISDTGERVLRVTAERLNSLLDLSSKSLVETQRLKPYLITMQRLKRLQTQRADALGL